MSKTIFLTGVLWLALFPAHTAMGAREEIIKARMEASVPDTTPGAREEAVGRAQVEIVADVLKSTLSSEHFALVKSLLDQAIRYIRTTQLLRFDTRDGFVRVEIECYVRRGDILKDAAALLLARTPVPPSVLVVVAEPAGDSPATTDARGTASAAISEALKDRGFEIAPIEQVQICHSDDEIISAALGDNAAAARFAKERFADVVVLGKADVSIAPEEGSLNVMVGAANVTLRLFRASDGKLVDSFAAEALVHGTDAGASTQAALQDACAKIAGDIQVAAAIAAGGTRPSEDVVITIENPGPEDRVREVMKTAASFVGQEPELLVYTERLARILIPYNGAMTPLLDTLVQQKYLDAGIEIRRAIQRNVQMRFTP